MLLNHAFKYNYIDDFDLLEENDIIRLLDEVYQDTHRGIHPISNEERAEQMRRWRSETDRWWINGDGIEYEVQGETWMVMFDEAADAYARELAEDLAGDYERELEAWKVKGNLCSLPMDYISFDTERYVRDIELSGDLDGFLASYDGCVHEVDFQAVNTEGKVFTTWVKAWRI